MDKNCLRNILLRLRGVTGWSQKEFAEYFNIPRRTLQEWELGNRKMPEYLLRLMVYKLENEELVKNFLKQFENSCENLRKFSDTPDIHVKRKK